MRQRSKTAMGSSTIGGGDNSGTTNAQLTRYQALLPPPPPGKTVCSVCAEYGDDDAWLIRHQLSCKAPPPDSQMALNTAASSGGGVGKRSGNRRLQPMGPSVAGGGLHLFKKSVVENNNTLAPVANLPLSSSVSGATSPSPASVSHLPPLVWNILRDQGNTAVQDLVAEEVSFIKMCYEDIVTVDNDITVLGAIEAELPVLTFTLEAPALMTDEVGDTIINASEPSRTFLLRISLVQGYPYTGPNVAWTVPDTQKVSNTTSPVGGGPQLPMSQQKKIQRLVAKTVSTGVESGSGCIQGLVNGVSSILNGEEDDSNNVLDVSNLASPTHGPGAVVSCPGTPMMLPKSAAPATPQLHPSNAPEETGQFPTSAVATATPSSAPAATAPLDELTQRKTQLLLLHLVDKVSSLQYTLDEANNKLAEIEEGVDWKKKMTTAPQLLFDTIGEHLVRDLGLLSGDLRSEYSRAMVKRYFKQYFDAELGARLRFLWSSPSTALDSDRQLGASSGGIAGSGAGGQSSGAALAAAAVGGRGKPSDDSGAAAVDSTSRYQQEFEQVAKLGEGGFAAVFSARKRVDGRLYAVKRVAMRRKQSERTLREVKTLANFQHPNIVRFYDAWVEAGNHCGDLPSSEDEEEEEEEESESDNDLDDDGGGEYSQGLEESSFDDASSTTNENDDSSDDDDDSSAEGGFTFGDVDSDTEGEGSQGNTTSSTPRGSFSSSSSSSDGGGDEWFNGNKKRMQYQEDGPTEQADSAEEDSVGSSTSSSISATRSQPSTIKKYPTTASGRKKTTSSTSALEGELAFPSGRTQRRNSDRGESKKRKQQQQQHLAKAAKTTTKGGGGATVTDSIFAGKSDTCEIQTLYITMEHCDSRTLKDAIDEGCFVGQSDTMNSIFRQLLSALAYLHQQGAVHRDMKPANVLFAQHAANYSDVKIADFGLARLVDKTEAVATNTKLSQKSSSAAAKKKKVAMSAAAGGGSSPVQQLMRSAITGSCGTALYAAPEQLTDDYGVLVDEYALGLLVYEMWLSALGKDYRERLDLLERLRKDEYMPSWFWEVGGKIPSIIARLTRKDATKRASCEDILNLAELPGEPAEINVALEVVSDHGVRMARRILARLKRSLLDSYEEVEGGGGSDGLGFTPSSVYDDDLTYGGYREEGGHTPLLNHSSFTGGGAHHLQHRQSTSAFLHATSPLPTPPQFLNFITETVSRVATTHNAELLILMSPVLPLADHYPTAADTASQPSSPGGPLELQQQLQQQQRVITTPVIFTEDGEAYSVPKYPCTLIAYHFARCPFYWESSKDAVIRFQHHGCEVVPHIHSGSGSGVGGVKGAPKGGAGGGSPAVSAVAAATHNNRVSSVFTFGVVSQGHISSLLDIQRDIEVLCYALELIHSLKSKEGGAYEIQFSHVTLQSRFKMFAGENTHSSSTATTTTAAPLPPVFGVSTGAISLDAMGGGSGGDDLSLDRKIDECLLKFCPGIAQFGAAAADQASSGTATNHGAAALAEVQVAIFVLKKLIETIILSPQFQSQCPGVHLSLCNQSNQTAPLVEGPLWRVVFHQPPTGKKGGGGHKDVDETHTTAVAVSSVTTVVARGGRLDNLAVRSRGLLTDPRGSFITWETTQLARCIKGRRTTVYPDFKGVLMSQHGMKHRVGGTSADDLTCPLYDLVARGGSNLLGGGGGGSANLGDSPYLYDRTIVEQLASSPDIHHHRSSLVAGVVGPEDTPSLLDVSGGPLKDKLLEGAMHLWADGVRTELQRNPRASPALRCTREFGFCVEVQLQREGLRMKAGASGKPVDLSIEVLVPNVLSRMLGAFNNNGGSTSNNNTSSQGGDGCGPSNSGTAGGTGLLSLQGGIPATIRVRYLGREQPALVEAARETYKLAMLDGFPRSVLVVDASLVDIRNCMTEFVGGVASAGAKGSSLPSLLEWLKRNSGGSPLTVMYSTVDKAVEIIVAGNALKGMGRAGGKGSRYTGKGGNKKGGGGAGGSLLT